MILNLIDSSEDSTTYFRKIKPSRTNQARLTNTQRQKHAHLSPKPCPYQYSTHPTHPPSLCTSRWKAENWFYLVVTSYFVQTGVSCGQDVHTNVGIKLTATKQNVSIPPKSAFPLLYSTLWNGIKRFNGCGYNWRSVYFPAYPAFRIQHSSQTQPHHFFSSRILISAKAFTPTDVSLTKLPKRGQKRSNYRMR